MDSNQDITGNIEKKIEKINNMLEQFSKETRLTLYKKNNSNFLQSCFKKALML